MSINDALFIVMIIFGIIITIKYYNHCHIVYLLLLNFYGLVDDYVYLLLMIVVGAQHRRLLYMLLQPNEIENHDITRMLEDN